MSLPPANWYSDPQQPAQLRYWDGTAWTEHVAPIPMPIAQPPAQPGAASAVGSAPAGKGMPAWAIVLIVVGGVVLIMGILTAIAIPVFLNQKDKEADAAAKYSATNVAQAVAMVGQDFALAAPIVTATQGGTVVEISGPDGTVLQTATLQPGVTFGGFVTYNSGEWCVWVSGENGPWHSSSEDGLAQGSCP